MAQYYYLIAQLQNLRYDQKPPMSSAAFFEMAESFLNKADVKIMKHISFVKHVESGAVIKKCGCKFIDDWLAWECAMRLNLARYRSIKMNNESSISDPVVEPIEAYNSATHIFTQEGSPLDGELLLDKARWDIIEEMSGKDFFNRNVVYAYYLKLLLLERRQIFNDIDIGFSEYKSLYAQIIDGPHDCVDNSGLNSTGEIK